MTDFIEQFKMDNTSEGERRAIRCALICIDEIINTGALKEDHFGKLNSTHRKYWDDLRNEIYELEKRM
jgi:hypothetical protein